MAILVMPTQVTAMGFLRLMTNMGLYDSLLPLIIPSIASPAVFYFMYSYLESSLPLSLVEAARIDGSGEFMTFNRIVLPIMKPAVAVQVARERTVSGLQQPLSDAEFMRRYSQPRNYGFNTAVGSGYAMGKNTIRACIHGDQTIMDGQTVKLRLLEPLQAGNLVIPQNTLVAGTGKVQGERLDIVVSSIEYRGNLLPVELAVYDSDGQKGLSVSSSLEQEAAKEAMANIGGGLGTSISFARSAGQQVAMDITRGLMQGGSQYLAKKFRTVQVHLKAGYELMLYAKQQ